MSQDRNRLTDIVLDESSLAVASSNTEHERRIALFDLRESNSFAVIGEQRGPYALVLALEKILSSAKAKVDEGPLKACLEQQRIDHQRRLANGGKLARARSTPPEEAFQLPVRMVPEESSR